MNRLHKSQLTQKATPLRQTYGQPEGPQTHHILAGNQQDPDIPLLQSLLRIRTHHAGAWVTRSVSAKSHAFLVWFSAPAAVASRTTPVPHTCNGQRRTKTKNLDSCAGDPAKTASEGSTLGGGRVKGLILLFQHLSVSVLSWFVQHSLGIFCAHQINISTFQQEKVASVLRSIQLYAA